ncbi:BglG family transcription antiterminator [Halobacillus sp. Marseille-Q1614]|uniref:BglG family transcription antiterminator n=1 Tax=Halobacillus sp. Marseille-Q1614 TaxID=2709134 RepID=UPI00157046DC|nr:BglG family transcription antiterminator [Halobacillus sp. Marseille-Q1614]
MYMTARERKIIDQLLEADHSVTVKEIAAQLDVSKRTIHRDLKGVEDIFSSYQLHLEKKAGSGLEVLGSDEKKKQLQEEISQQTPSDYTPEERHVIILSRLLEAKDPIKLMSLANELGVTVATVSNDLDKIEEDLFGFHLTLLRKRGYGVEIQGEESKIREAIGFLIMRHMDELDFINILRENLGNSSARTVDSVSDQLLGLVDKEKLMLIERSVDEIRASLTYDLADSAYIGLVIHLALAIERIQQGEIIEIDENYLSELRETKEFSLASRLIRQLEATFQLKIPEAEMGYITMHLMGAKVRYNQDSFLESTSLSVAFKAKQLIDFVSKEIGVNLHASSHLLNDLVVHLKPSIYRIEQKMDIQNPLMDQIESDYKELFRIVENAAAHVFPEFHFPKEETAYLVMHFASALLNDEKIQGVRVLVVCSSGIGTAKILAAKLNQEFKEIEKVEHVSLFDLNDMDRYEFDLVVSTVGLLDFKDYIQVSPMLPSGDVQKIEHAIRRLKVTKQTRIKNESFPEMPAEDETVKTIQASVQSVQRYATAVHQLLDSLSITQGQETASDEAVNQAVSRLRSSGIAKDASLVKKALTEREKLGGLGIPGTGLALYHTRTDEIKQPSFTVHILEDPIKIMGMDQQETEMTTMLLMLAPKDFHQEGLELLSFLSSLIVEDSNAIETLESKDKDKILHYLSNQLHHFLRKKLNTKGD